MIGDRRGTFVECPRCGDAVLGYVDGEPCPGCGTVIADAS